MSYEKCVIPYTALEKHVLPNLSMHCMERKWLKIIEGTQDSWSVDSKEAGLLRRPCNAYDTESLHAVHGEKFVAILS